MAAEYKIQYFISPGVAKQEYDVRLFLFFADELDPAQTSFFSSLYEAVRLHLPKVRAYPLLLYAVSFASQCIPNLGFKEPAWNAFG